MIILITENGYLLEKGEPPKVGRRYILEDAENGTLAQNKAFHALVQEYWRSGSSSYNAERFTDFRDMIKRDLGAGFESYIYSADDGLHKVKSLEQVPEGIPRSHIMGRLKSWADYTKKERMYAIDAIIAEMIQVGVVSAKFQEILQGLEK